MEKKHNIFWIFVLIILFSGMVNIHRSLAQIPEETPAPYAPLKSNDKAGKPVGGDSSLSLPVYSFFQPVGELETSSSTFGYVLINPHPYVWLDTNPGQRVVFPNQDSVGFVDDDFRELNIGFSFPFFENSYTNLFVSSNGLITFGEGDTNYRNVDIPLSSPPNNLITPFWEDLDINPPQYGSEVRYRLMDSPRRFVVEWRNVVRHNVENPPPLTFQVVLYENGDIDFQYQKISGEVSQASAGIEDIDGRDGLRYFYKQAGLAAGTAVRFERPKTHSGRVKTLPAVAGEFAIQKTANFAFKVVNTGSVGADTYTIDVNASSPIWKIAVYRRGSQEPLSDTNQDGKIDTGPVSQGATLELHVQASAPPKANPGDWTEITILARSTKNPAASQSSKLQAAVPAPFAQAYTDQDSGFRLGLYARTARLYPRMEENRWFSGSTLAVTPKPDGRFRYSWEMSGIKVIEEPESPPRVFYWSDLEYLEIDRFGNSQGRSKKLTDNEAAAQFTFDRYPALSVTSDGYTGVLWMREVWNANSNINSNIYLSILNPYLPANTPPVLINVTGNTVYRGEAGAVAPLFALPKLAATDSGRFVAAWAARTQVDSSQDAHEKSDIWYAVYDQNGSLVRAPSKLTNSDPATAFFTGPVVVNMTGGKALLAYNVLNEQAQSYSLLYATISGSGTASVPSVLTSSGGGWGIDGVQLVSGEVLLAWTHSSRERISYALLKENSGQISVTGPVSASAPDKREVDYLSITGDSSGNGIITWMDSSWNNHLYYLLVGKDGAVKTPPMSFYSSSSNDIPIITSSTGQGIAYFDGVYINYLPIVRR